MPPKSISCSNNGAGTWDNNSGQDYSFSVSTSTSLTATDQPGGFELLGNYPNPFNPSTSVSFTLPEGGRVFRCRYFDTAGRLVDQRDGFFPGAVTFALPFTAGNLPSGDVPVPH